MKSGSQIGGILLILLAFLLGGFLLWYVLQNPATSPQADRATGGGVIWERGQPLP